jgi:hypothetical protein
LILQSDDFLTFLPGDDGNVALLRGDGGGGVVGANHQLKRCDYTMKQEAHGSNRSPNTPYAHTAAQPLECHSMMLSMNEHWEPALCRSDGSTVENHKVKREGIDREDHRRATRDRKFHMRIQQHIHLNAIPHP